MIPLLAAALLAAAPEAPPRWWVLAADGRAVGPYTAAEFESACGRPTDEVLVCRDGDSTWTTALRDPLLAGGGAPEASESARRRDRFAEPAGAGRYAASITAFLVGLALHAALFLRLLPRLAAARGIEASPSAVRRAAVSPATVTVVIFVLLKGFAATAGRLSPWLAAAAVLAALPVFMTALVLDVARALGAPVGRAWTIAVVGAGSLLAVLAAVGLPLRLLGL